MGGNSASSMGTNPVVISAAAKHTATLIFLHGLGDTGYGWADAMASICSPHVKVICPTAPKIPVTLNSGFRMPSWFDLMSLDPNGSEDEKGINEAAESVHHMIEQELKNGIPSNRIMIGGFSQGGALAMYSALKYPKTLAGVVALSSWMPLHKNFPAAIIGNTEIAFLQCHGDCDPVVPYRWGQMTSTLMKSFLKNYEFKTFQGLAHSSCDMEMRDVKAFLDKNMPSL